MQVAHNDGNPANNHVGNLRYATARENTQDKFRHGTVVRGERIYCSKLTEADAVSIRKSDLPTAELAKVHGVTQSHINAVRSGRRWAWLR